MEHEVTKLQWRLMQWRGRALQALIQNHGGEEEEDGDDDEEEAVIAFLCSGSKFMRDMSNRERRKWN